MARFFCVLFILLLLAPFRATAYVDELRRTPVVQAVKSVSPSVVSISAVRVIPPSRDPFTRLLEEGFLGRPSQGRKSGSLGSGVIINSQSGLILTNAHVIAGASDIVVRLADGRELAAEMIGSDPDFDLAVLGVKSKETLPVVKMGNSEEILIGETVIAIGNPYGFDHTVTTGVVSALKRTLNSERGRFGSFIQTDAAINPGNSGGPLLNIHGELIGINTAIHAKGEGIGFAIPINKARAVVAELINAGHVAPVWLGIAGHDLNQHTAHYFGLPNTHGMIVTEVFERTPASGAALRPGDVILSVNGMPIKDKDEYLNRLRNQTKSEFLHLGILRQKTRLRIQLRPAVMTAKMAAELMTRRWGFSLGKNKTGRGALVSEVLPNSPAEKIRLLPGDIIHQIGNVRLRGKERSLAAFLRNRMARSVLLRVQRGQSMHWVRMAL